MTVLDQGVEDSVHLSFVVLGHPRSGSAALSRGLRDLGLDVGHERPGKDGLVSWWHVGFLDDTNDGPVFRKSNKTTPMIRADKIFFYIRDPKAAISSIVMENENHNRDNNSFRFRRRIILEKCGFDIGAMNEIAAAATSYICWNKLASDAAENARPILVEQPDLSIIRPDLCLAQLPRENTTQKKFGKQKIELSRAQIVENTPAEIRADLDVFESYYDRD